MNWVNGLLGRWWRMLSSVIFIYCQLTLVYMMYANVLTHKQFTLWKMRRSGLSASEIASRLGISRQAVHKGLQAVEAKISKALISTARSSRIEIRRIDLNKGFLVGYSPGLNVDVYVTLSYSNGVQIWFRHRGNCKECSLRENCKRIIFNEARERGIELPDVEGIEPSELAEILFKSLEVGE